MGREIERKFLVSDESWRAGISRSEDYVQGYLAGNERCSIRVRICGDRAWFNIKSATPGASRLEFEYPIPREDAADLLAHLSCDCAVEKRRHFVPCSGHEWEVDEFKGANAPLVIAEIELASEAQPFERPSWLGQEVTADKRYYNFSLARTPYATWKS
jgi:adenylate cyclase